MGKLFRKVAGLTMDLKKWPDKSGYMAKILVVDDEEDQEDLILQRFSGKSFLRGFEFVFARDGLEALKMIQSDPEIEIALIDINMPEMDGLTLLEKSKTYNPVLGSVMISAYGDMSNIRTAMNRGAFDFLTKPIDMADLEITLQKTISQVRQLRENARTLHENLTLKQRASELEMQALRAQMNPHFIFNSLSSINNFILKNDQTRASEYLVKFSKLIRLILENSISPLISLEQELDALRLYMELESLRFQHHFDYRIDFPDDLDLGSIKVPPLILQPFVENSIHHGLMPKGQPGHLKVSICEIQDRLEMTIEDDGIGREMAALKKLNTSFKKSSLGMAVTTERIGLIHREHTDRASVKIRDLADPEGKPAGTVIVINIPLMV